MSSSNIIPVLTQNLRGTAFGSISETTFIASMKCRRNNRKFEHVKDQWDKKHKGLFGTDCCAIGVSVVDRQTNSTTVWEIW